MWYASLDSQMAGMQRADENVAEVAGFPGRLPLSIALPLFFGPIQRTLKVLPSFLPEEVLMAKYAVGDRVTQAQYGAGTITAVDDSRTVIEFDEHGTRMFATSIVTLERSSTPAPARAARGRKKPVPKPA